MTKKDYIKFARMFRTYRSWKITDQQEALFDSIIKSTAILFLNDSPRFDRERFLNTIQTGKGLGEDND